MARIIAVARADIALFLHLVNDTGRAAVAEPQFSLQVGSGNLFDVDRDLDGLQKQLVYLGIRAA